MSERDPRMDPKPGDVLLKLGVRRTALTVTNLSVQSFFSSARWRHREWAPKTTWLRATGKTYDHRPET